MMLEDEIYRLNTLLLKEKDLRSNFKIYFAHHLWKYNTEIEKYEIDVIKQRFPESTIINPNGHIVQNREEKEIMRDCIKSVEFCDILVFSSVDGIVGKGVVEEVTKAMEFKKRIYFIFGNELKDAEYCKFNLIKNSYSNRVYAKVSNVRFN